MERVVLSYDAILQRGVGTCCGNCEIAPCVVDIGTNLLTLGIVDCYNVALQVLFEEEIVKRICSICAGAILNTNRAAGFVVDVQQAILGRT